MRALSERQAGNCEEAREPVCRCRCGGALHGARRGSSLAFFSSLPADDPHYIPSAEARKEQKRLEREERNRRRYEALASLWRADPVR